jgi:fatty acid desaturase
MSTPTQSRARLGFLLVMVGLIIQIVAALFWGPAMFIISAAVGLPLVLVGAAVVFFTTRRVGARESERGPGPHAPA